MRFLAFKRDNIACALDVILSLIIDCGLILENRKVVTMSAKNGHSDKVEKASRGKFTSFMSKFGKIEPSQKNSQEVSAGF